jgi:hypothetical protein
MVRPARRTRAAPAPAEVAIDPEPAAPGVILLYRGGAVVYVQYAIDCRATAAAIAARRVMAFDRAAFVPCAVEGLEAAAAALVARHEPEYNLGPPPPGVILAHLARARALAREVVLSHGRQGVAWPDLVATVERALGGAAVDRVSLGKLLDLDPAVRWLPASLAYVAG